MTLRASIGQRHPADITKEWEGDFKGFVKAILHKVPVTEDKAVAGWVSGAHFKPAYRHSKNYVARHFLSLDYDHIKPEDVERVITGVPKGCAFLAYTTWSHKPDAPRIRLWIPLSRGVDDCEFQAISRRVASRVDIELAARESHTPCQFMYRPAQQKDIPFCHWQDVESPALDVDKVLGEYDDWRDKSSWPKRRDNDELYDSTDATSPLDKPGLVGAFCRAFTVTEAIARFDLPYRAGSSENRWTYSTGSRADGAVSYDDDTKLHSYHDTDPARGQHNAYDLVRLHLFGSRDVFDTDTPIESRPSTGAMEAFCREVTELREFFSAGFEPISDDDAQTVQAVGGADALPEEITRAAGRCTDLANAKRIQDAYGRHILAVAGTFYIWQETHWRADIYEGHVAKKIADLSKLIRDEYRMLKDKLTNDDGGTLTEEHAAELKTLWAFALRCEDKGKMDACRELSRKLLDHPAEKLNTHRNLFNARNWTIDLETGKTYAHRPEDFLTECAPTDYDPAAQCPRFERFMDEIFDGDAQLIAFMKRWLGYCLTGETRAQALVFHVGKAGNGKSTLMNVMQHVLGGYAAIGPATLLTGQAGIKNDVATLVGRRMVTIDETKQNEQFDQAQLKNLSGGGKLVARLLFKEYFEFNPTHKLQIFTNHEPGLSGDDAGIWRRVMMVRYRVRFGTPEQVASGEYHRPRDEKLEDVLKLESPGILRWLVEGAREWYASGLQPPTSVTKDTSDLRSHQDVMEQFLKERVVKDAKGRVPYSNSTESLYVTYKGWMLENGHKAKGRGTFLRLVREYLPTATEAKWQEKGEWFRGFSGIRLARNGELTE